MHALPAEAVREEPEWPAESCRAGWKDPEAEVRGWFAEYRDGLRGFYGRAADAGRTVVTAFWF